jgi:hypothetical protein
LIVVADNLGDENTLNAAIATVIDDGRKSVYRTFDALVINIRYFVLVRVRDSDVVQHTDLIELVGPSALPRPVRASLENESLAPVHGNTSSFNILMKFFEVAQTYTLRPFKPSDKVLPPELFDKIIEMLDPDTYVKYGEVSEAFHHHVSRCLRLWQQPNLPDRGDFSHHVIHADPSGLPIFQGRVIRSNFRPVASGDIRVRWAPVIGQDKRQSMMVGCAITDATLASHDLPIAVESQLETDNPASTSPFHFGTEYFYFAKFASVGDVSSAWRNYLRNVLIPPPKRRSLVVPALAILPFLLPRNTRCIPLIPGLGSGRKTSEFAGMIWLKKPADFELRQATIKEALDFLRVAHQSHETQPVRQGWLAIIFGTKTQCFRWDIRDDSGEKPPVMTPLDNGAVLDIGIELERGRFEELFGQFRDEVDASCRTV